MQNGLLSLCVPGKVSGRGGHDGRQLWVLRFYFADADGRRKTGGVRRSKDQIVETSLMKLENRLNSFYKRIVGLYCVQFTTNKQSTNFYNDIQHLHKLRHIKGIFSVLLIYNCNGKS